jgi:hypothetical protein
MTRDDAIQAHTANLKARFIEHFRLDRRGVAAAKAVGRSVDTAQKWADTDQDFAVAVANASKSDDGEIIEKAARSSDKVLSLRCQLWILQTRRPDKFGPAVEKMDDLLAAIMRRA